MTRAKIAILVFAVAASLPLAAQPQEPTPALSEDAAKDNAEDSVEASAQDSEEASAKPVTVNPTPAQTRAKFQAICDQQAASDDLFFGRSIIDDLQERLQQPDLSPALQVGIRGRLAIEFRRLGDSLRSIELLDAAFAIAQSNQMPAEVIEQLHLDLGLSHMRRAEDENCILSHSTHFGHEAANCTLPVGPESLHSKRDHTHQAGEHLLKVLANRSDPLAQWLLVLSRMLADDYPAGVPQRYRLPPGAFTPQAPFPKWRNIAGELGIDVLDLAGGAVVDDFDGDGLLDVVTSTWDPCGPMKAFRNNGDGTFSNVASSWALDSQFGGLNMAPADYDNDGDLDILVMRGAWRGEQGRVTNSLLRNELREASGRFVDVTQSAGLAGPAFPTQAASWGDYDGDGDLDLYIGNEADTGLEFPSQLFRNRGDGTFVDVAAAAGVQNFSFAKSASWGDYDEDGDLDLYVSNMGHNRLYRNNGGTFTDIAPALGVAGPFNSFASWFFDYDNDGDLDLFVADYGSDVWKVAASYCCPEALPDEAAGHPVLYRNVGGRFVDISAQVGLKRPLLPMGSNYGDLDNDGWLDIYLGTGVPDLTALMPNVLLKNDGGKKLHDITFASSFGVLQKGHGIAFSDIDNDGDQDVFEQLGGAYPADPFFNALFENPGTTNGWVTLKLVGTKANRSGVGARIAVTVRTRQKESRTIHILAGTGGSFGASTLRQEIGLGDAQRIESITIRWPGSKTVQTFKDVAMNRFYRLTEGSDSLEPIDLPRIKLAAH